MHVQSRWAANLNLSVLFFFFFFWGSRCRCRRHCFSSVSLKENLRRRILGASTVKERVVFTWNITVPDPNLQIRREGGSFRSSRPLEKGGGGGRQAVSSKDRGAELPWIRHCINASRIIIAWLVTHLYRAKHKQFAKHQYHGCQPWLHRH